MFTRKKHRLGAEGQAMKKESKQAMKKVEEEIMLLVNQRLFEKGEISQTMYEKAQRLIVSAQK